MPWIETLNQLQEDFGKSISGHGERSSATNTVYSGDEVLLTLISDVIRWCKGYFEDVLSPNNTSSMEEAGSLKFGVDPSIKRG